MPATLQYIDFIISSIGFIITIATFFAALRVNKKIKTINAQEQFHIKRSEILNELQGYICSINNDKLQNNDPGNTLFVSISQYLTDLYTKYTHFSFHTRRCIKSTLKKIYVTSPDWNKIANSLISLKNCIEKEL